MNVPSSEKRVLIVGCGYVGAATADLFHEAGWAVEGWTRSSESAAKLSGKPYPISAVDVSDREQVSKTAGDFAVVIHGASTRGGDADRYRQVYRQGAENLVRRFPDSRILFTSSTSVYAHAGGELVNEESPAEPTSETGRILRDAEQLVVAAGGTVARLAGIYGPNRSVYLQKFRRGEAALDAADDRIINQIHRDDAARALFLLAQERTAAGQIYNVADDRPVRRSEVYRWLAGRLGEPTEIRPAVSSTRRGTSSKRVSNARLRALGWEPLYPSFVDGMEKSVLLNSAG